MRLVRALAASLLLIVPSVATAETRPQVETAKGTLSDVVTRYERWRGGASFLSSRTIRWTGKQTANGSSGPLSRWATRSGDYRVESRIGALSNTLVVNAQDGWRTAFSGQVQRLAAEELGDAKREALILFTDLARQRQGLIRRGPDELVDGLGVAVVSVPDGDDGIDYLLASDGRLVSVRLRADGKVRTIRYSDWRHVEGVRLPFREVEEDQDGDRIETEFATIEVNRPIADGQFDRPQATVAILFGKPGASGWLDFEFFQGERIFLDVVLNGRPVRALLDSGAEATVIDSGYLAQNGLAASSTVSATGLNATASAGVVPGVSLRLGEVSLRGLTVATIDLGTVSMQMRHALPVILGAEIFRETVVDIDFANRRIAFRDPSTFVAPQDAVPRRLTSGGGLYMVDASIAGLPARLDLDLGSGSPLTLWSGFWKRLDLRGRRSTSVIGGVGGLGEADITMLPGVQLGGIDFGPVPTQLMPSGGPGVARARSDGNIGVPLLKRFRLIVDLPHDRVWFVGPADTATPFKKDRSGVAATMVEGRLQVIGVAAGSPAEAAGIRRGDIIVSIDGGIAASLDARRLGDDPAGTVHRLVLADGRTITLTLSDYF